MKKMNKKGFTIVELVIVIAVIAILAAVMIPTFGGIIEKANKSSVQQTAQALYKQALAIDLADGAQNGQDGNATYNGDIKVDGKDVKYIFEDDTFKTFSYTDKGYTATFDGTNWTVQ